jgi:hypothetical protein
MKTPEDEAFEEIERIQRTRTRWVAVQGEKHMNENTFAFPHEITHLQKPLTAGMTLRDYFAAKAMQGLMDAAMPMPEIADAAYAMADDMLKAREE